MISPTGLALIQRFEGLKLVAYRDPAGVWTIGYGHTGGVMKGDTITVEHASWLLAQDCAAAEDWVAARAQSPTDNQFDAMVSLTYNIGPAAFLSSTVRQQHNAGNFPAAGYAFLLWDKAHVDGKLVPLTGLLTRRYAERALYELA